MSDASSASLSSAPLHALAGLESEALLAGIHADGEPESGLLERLCGGFADYRLRAAEGQLQDVIRSALDAGNVFRGPASRDDIAGQVDRAASFNRLILAWIEFEERLRTALPLPGAAAKAAETVVALIDPAIDATGPVVSNIIRRAGELDLEISRTRIERGIDAAETSPDRGRREDARSREMAPV